MTRCFWTAKRGFTLIELLVVIAIIGLLSSIVLVSLNSARAKARDARRLSDMKNLVTALYLYYDAYGYFPANSDVNDDCSSWDVGLYDSGDTFIDSLRTSGFIGKVPGDPRYEGCDGYYYYRYNAGSGGCDAARGRFFVLGVLNMETSGGHHPQSPGWSCSGRDWQDEFEWVTGGFEN